MTDSVSQFVRYDSVHGFFLPHETPQLRYCTRLSILVLVSCTFHVAVEFVPIGFLVRRNRSMFRLLHLIKSPKRVKFSKNITRFSIVLWIFLRKSIRVWFIALVSSYSAPFWHFVQLKSRQWFLILFCFAFRKEPKYVSAHYEVAETSDGPFSFVCTKRASWVDLSFQVCGTYVQTAKMFSSHRFLIDC